MNSQTQRILWLMKKNKRLVSVNWICKKCDTIVIKNVLPFEQEILKCDFCGQLYELFIDMTVLGKKSSKRLK